MKFRGFFAGSALALALTLTACGGGNSGNTSTGSTGSNSGAPVEITIGTPTDASLVFEPTTAEAPANTPVKFTFQNKSTSLPHNLKFSDGITAGTSDLVAAGASETFEFTTPGAGTYKFICNIHPGMEGTLTVK
jgi:plastocyanin